MSDIKNYVEISFEANYVQVDRDPVGMQISPESMINPPVWDGAIRNIIWDKNDMAQTSVNFTTNDPETGSNFIPFGEEKYADWVQPYVDLWQAEKDRLEQEQQQAQQEYAKFENRKERALNAIQTDYENALSKGFVRTSMEFDADVSVESSATLSGTNVSLAYMATMGAEAPTTTFRDFYGLKRELDQSKVATLICQINEAQNHIREQKYKFKDMVKDTFDNDSLNEVIAKCIYTTLDFTGDEVTEIPFTQAKTIQERIDRYGR